MLFNCHPQTPCTTSQILSVWFHAAPGSSALVWSETAWMPESENVWGISVPRHTSIYQSWQRWHWRLTAAHSAVHIAASLPSYLVWSSSSADMASCTPALGTPVERGTLATLLLTPATCSQRSIRWWGRLSVPVGRPNMDGAVRHRVHPECVAAGTVTTLWIPDGPPEHGPSDHSLILRHMPETYRKACT